MHFAWVVGLSLNSKEGPLATGQCERDLGHLFFRSLLVCQNFSCIDLVFLQLISCTFLLSKPKWLVLCDVFYIAVAANSTEL